MKASDISDLELCRAIADTEPMGGWGYSWRHWGAVAERIDAPPRVVMAKFRRCKGRGLVDGCDCGCRGDWELTQSGMALIWHADNESTGTT